MLSFILINTHALLKQFFCLISSSQKNGELQIQSIQITKLFKSNAPLIQHEIHISKNNLVSRILLN